MSEETTPDEDCALCDKAMAIVGLVIAAAFIYISVDVITKGNLTTMLGGLRGRS